MERRSKLEWLNSGPPSVTKVMPSRSLRRRAHWLSEWETLEANIENFARRTSESPPRLVSRETASRWASSSQKFIWREQGEISIVATLAVILKHIGLFSTSLQLYSWIGRNRRARLSGRTWEEPSSRRLVENWKVVTVIIVVQSFKLSTIEACAHNSSYVPLHGTWFFLGGAIHGGKTGFKRASSTGGKTRHGNRWLSEYFPNYFDLIGMGADFSLPPETKYGYINHPQTLS